MQTNARRVSLGVFFVLLWSSASAAQANSITLTLDCAIQNTQPATCTPTSPVGTVTLSDSLVNPNRVDVSITLLGQFSPDVVGIDELHLNYDNSITVGGNVNRKFGLVSQLAAIGDHAAAGDVDINPDALGPYHTRLDLGVDPNNGPGMTWTGSLVIYSTESGHAESDLNVSMFNLKDADGLLCAAVNTLNANQNQQYGARGGCGVEIGATAVPEPATLSLVGLALFGLASGTRRLTRGGK